MSFAAVLGSGFAAGRRLCVGIDPHSFLLADWNLPDSAAGCETFGRSVVAAAHSGRVLALKPQIAFFERFGSAGFVALERVLADARQAGVPVIADVKRGDIGSTFAAYAAAWLTPGSPLEVDAITAVAYQGFGSLAGGLQLVTEHGKGMFVLAATSNPEAAQTQQARRADGLSVAAAIVQEAGAFNALTAVDSAAAALATAEAAELPGSVGVVLGATLQLSDFQIDTARAAAAGKPVLPILAPGFGAQGARLDDAQQLFGALSRGLIPNESRGVLQGGAQGIAERIRQRSEQIAEVLA